LVETETLLVVADLHHAPQPGADVDGAPVHQEELSLWLPQEVMEASEGGRNSAWTSPSVNAL